jgi:nitrile hydratase subunit beta
MAGMLTMLKRNGAHDVGGMAGLGPVPMAIDDAVGHPAWESRALGATVAAVTRGMLVPPTQRAVIEALHPVVYLSMGYYERWLYALEQCAIKAGVVTADEIETRVAVTLANPDAPLPVQHRPEILDAVKGLIAHGVPPGPERLGQPPRFAPGDIVRTKRIELQGPGRPHTRIPGYAQARVGVVEIVHRPMLFEDALVASGQIEFEYVYAVRLRTRDVWADAQDRDSVTVDLWESYLEKDALPAFNPPEASQ